MGRTLSLFADADPEWMDNRIVNGLSSGEGLIWSLRDPVEVTEPVKENDRITGYQTVTKSDGVSDKRLLVLEPEFAQTLKVLKREGNTLSPVIRQAWDGGTLSIMTKNDGAKATDTHVSIIGHITRQELDKTLSDTDCFNGFGNRILWPLVRRSKLLPDGGCQLDLEPLQRRMTHAVAIAKGISEMSRSPAARELWHHLYPELTAERPGVFGAVVGRGEAQTLRLSMLYALLDGSDVIDIPHLQAAVAVWRYCEASARLIFVQDDETGDPNERMLLQAIRQEPGINRRGLHRAVGGRITASEMVQALASLRDRGEVRFETVATGGRPSERWFPIIATSPPSTVIVPPPEPVEGEPAASATADAFASQPDETPSLTLAELFAAVSDIGGVLRRADGGCIVDAPADRITPAITAAVNEHQDSLLAMLPEPEPVSSESQPDADGSEMTAEAFFGELSQLSAT